MTQTGNRIPRRAPGPPKSMMRMRTRKLIGAVGLITLVAFWPLFMLAFGHTTISRYYAPAQLIFFLVFGFIWLVPAAFLIRWMHRPDRG